MASGAGLEAEALAFEVETLAGNAERFRGRFHLALVFAERGLDHFAFDARQRDTIVAAATGARRVAQALEQAGRPSEIAAAVGPGARPELVALAGAMGPETAARGWLQSLRHVVLDIDGHDLLEAGVAAGPEIGRGLQAALVAKLDGLAQGRDAELAAALRAARASG